MLGHELTHIRNGDVQLMVVAVIIAGVVGFFGELFFRLFTTCRWNSGGSGSSSSSRRHRPSSSSTATARAPAAARSSSIIIAVALIVLAWLLSQVVKLALSRSREYLADAGSVELTKNPDAMISALRKIENRGELPGATSAVMELCVDNPREGFADLFATHPSVQSAGRQAGAICRRPRSRPAGAARTRRHDAPGAAGRTSRRRPAPPPLPPGAVGDAGAGRHGVPAAPGRRGPWGPAAADTGRRQSPAGLR